MYDHRVTDESARAVVTALTDALCSVIGESARAGTWVTVQGIPPQRWGIGGEVGASAGPAAGGAA